MKRLRDWVKQHPSKQAGPTANLQITGQLSPIWVEWLMGWPSEWTGLARLATAKCRSAPPLLGDC